MQRIVALLIVLAAASPARAGGDNLAEAKRHFALGVAAYDQGRYDEALKEFGEAHAHSHSPALYFNMAACEEHLDHFQAAALLLSQYLTEKPDAEDREAVRVRIQALQERDERLHKLNELPPVKTAAPAPAPTQTPTRARLKYTWVMLGATGAAGAAAIGVGAYTVAHHADLKSGCGNTAAGCSPSQVSGLRSTAIATDVLIGVTAAAAVATVVFAVVESRKARAHADEGHAGRVAFIGNGIRF